MTKEKPKRLRLPMIAIVGRANVGKSTLWNRLIERKQALVSKSPHTTRDRAIQKAIWRGREFFVVDTGGFDTEKDEIGKGIRDQALRAMEDADLLLFVVDGKTGVVPDDKQLVKEIRRIKKPTLLLVNKIDNQKDLSAANEKQIYALGLGDPIAISAATGKGTGDMLDIAFDAIGKGFASEEIQTDETAEEEKPLRLVIMGKPNVGKSSLTNAILGEERVIVSPIAHTTREPQDTTLTYKGRQIVLVDTAGMRKKSRVERGLEAEAMKRNIRALEHADIALLVFDASEQPGLQDKKLAGLMKETKKGLILVANKWDLVKDKETGSTNEYEAMIRMQFPFLDWSPMFFVSVKTGKRAVQLLDEVLKIDAERKREITYNALNKLLKTVLKLKKPIATIGPKSPYVYDVEQIGTEPPEFRVTVVGDKQTIHPSWLKFLEKQIRKKFGYHGTPIVLKAKNVLPSKHARRTDV